METFHAWPPKAHGHLTVRNASSLTSRVPKVLIVPILPRHTCSKSLLKVKVVSQLWVPITLKRDSYTSNIQWHRIGITTPKGRNESVDGTKARTSGQKLIPLAPCLTLRLWCQVWVAHPLKLCHLQPTWLLELPPLGVCTLPWQMTHVLGISNILKSPLQLRLYLQSFMHGPQEFLQRNWSCYLLPDFTNFSLECWWKPAWPCKSCIMLAKPATHVRRQLLLPVLAVAWLVLLHHNSGALWVPEWLNHGEHFPSVLASFVSIQYRL